MSTFAPDTSGYVDADDREGPGWLWSDLSPFTQGYVEALFASMSRGGEEARVRLLAVLDHSESGSNFTFATGLPYAPLEGSDREEAFLGDLRKVIRPPAFSDLAPETLAAILKDCGTVGAASGQGSITFMYERGKQFWRVRNIKGLISGLTHFPPLTPYLSDDGKVYLRAAT